MADTPTTDNQLHLIERNTAYIQLFAQRMNSEMVVNATKGDWVNMTSLELAYELGHHQAKLIKALGKLEQAGIFGTKEDVVAARAAICEHAADVGNIAMMIAVRKGRLTSTTPTTPTPQPDYDAPCDCGSYTCPDCYPW